MQVAAPVDDTYVDTDPSALTDFRSTLDPYGNWVEDTTYGTVWTPNQSEVGADFQPYETAGQWDYQGSDYAWISDYAWGWVCFHYGRWVWSQAVGWMWIPGRDYAPAWVLWRMGEDGYPYVGWAPLAPAWGWFGGGAAAYGFSTAEPWTFTARASLVAPSTSSHAIGGAQAAALLPHSKPYVPATPSASAPGSAPGTVWSTQLTPAVPHGPPPSALGIDLSSVAHRALSPREQRARQLSRPSTAQALGARGPTPHVVHGARALGPRGAPDGKSTGARARH
jgi:hypothetical protein